MHTRMVHYLAVRGNENLSHNLRIFPQFWPIISWTTKITSEKNSYFDEGWLCIGRFKVGSVPGMTNK